MKYISDGEVLALPKVLRSLEIIPRDHEFVFLLVCARITYKTKFLTKLKQRTENNNVPVYR